MPDDENKPLDAAIELSDEELLEVSGGLSLFLNAALFRETNVFASSGKGSSPSIFATQTIESAGLQVVAKDATTEDLNILGDLLGDATAIDG